MIKCFYEIPTEERAYATHIIRESRKLTYSYGLENCTCNFITPANWGVYLPILESTFNGLVSRILYGNRYKKLILSGISHGKRCKTLYLYFYYKILHSLLRRKFFIISWIKMQLFCFTILSNWNSSRHISCTYLSAQCNKMIPWSL